MNMQQGEENAYAFCLDEVKNKYLYYRTVSLYSGTSENNGRDLRCPHPVIIANFDRIMGSLKQPFRWVRGEEDLNQWQAGLGWALIPNKYASQRLCLLLEPSVCVKSAIGLFWDVKLRKKGATKRRPLPEVRQAVLARDNYRCIECWAVAEDGVRLTMDHVIPHSRGGETATGNLVTLCENCHKKYGNAHHPHLFSLARLDHDWDPQLFDVGVVSDPDVRNYAVMLSQNIMVSRVRWE